MKALLSVLFVALLTSAAVAGPESDQIHTGDPRHTPAEPQTAPAPRYTAEQRAILTLQEEGRGAVAELVAQLESAADAEAVADLQRRIEKAKLATRVAVIEKIIEFADAQGDTDKADEGRRVLQILTEGAPAPSSSIQRPAPQPQEGR